jgi:geranylgeranyl reductase family protein
VEHYDAVVVGAGPAGSVTAIHLARGGARVLLIDKASFPRDKPCGGGLTLRAVRQLPVDPAPVVEHEVDRMEFRLGWGSRFERRGRRGPFVLMTQRRRLDQFLAEQAAAAGAEFRDGVKVSDLAERSLRVDGEEVAAEIVVGADGANGTAARVLGLGGPITHGVAYEGNAPYDLLVQHPRAKPGDALANRAGRERYRGLAVIELGTIPGGYGWVFPKGDHVNVGVGGWEAEGPKLRGHLAEICRRHGIDDAGLESVRGHRLPLRRAGFVPARGRALLVGDAAGLVDPLTGDGMYEAFISARLAADAALDVLAGRAETVEPYAERLTRAVGPLAGASWGAKFALDRFPRTTFALARAPLVWPVVERLVRGDISAPGEAKGLARPPLKAIAALARIAGQPAA